MTPWTAAGLIALGALIAIVSAVLTTLTAIVLVRELTPAYQVSEDGYGDPDDGYDEYDDPMPDPGPDPAGQIPHPRPVLVSTSPGGTS